ncbi:fas-associated factor [Anaeramoeba flamelloides]|uniref:Fas-associated factor n=1 Tax=Anaeramoeba flamelloides TaxID=1746091 RepID=A0AAV7ZMU6_9EUKA|nr:fas-associated factor [Anaeramoeba flamelloides]
MSKLRHLRKTNIKTTFRFALILVSDLMIKDNLVYLKYKRGSQTGTTRKVYVNELNYARFYEERAINCTFFENKKKKGVFDRKILTISLKVIGQNAKNSKKRSKESTIGRVSVDISKFLNQKEPTLNMYKFNVPKSNSKNITITPFLLMCFQVSEQKTRQRLTPLLMDEQIKEKLILYLQNLEKKGQTNQNEEKKTNQNEQQSSLVPIYKEYTDFTDFTAVSNSDSDVIADEGIAFDDNFMRTLSKDEKLKIVQNHINQNKKMDQSTTNEKENEKEKEKEIENEKEKDKEKKKKKSQRNEKKNSTEKKEKKKKYTKISKNPQKKTRAK